MTQSRRSIRTRTHRWKLNLDDVPVPRLEVAAGRSVGGTVDEEEFKKSWKAQYTCALRGEVLDEDPQQSVEKLLSSREDEPRL